MQSKLDQALQNLREIGEAYRAPQLEKDIVEGLQNALDSLLTPAADPTLTEETPTEETEENVFVPLANINDWAKVIYLQFRSALSPESKKGLFKELATLPRNGLVKIGDQESYPATAYETLKDPLEKRLQEVGSFNFSNPTEKFVQFDGPPVKCAAHNRPFVFQPLVISGNTKEGRGYLRGYFRQMKNGTAEPICRDCQLRLIKQARQEDIKIFFLTRDQIDERNERFAAEKAARQMKDKEILHGGYNVGKQIEAKKVNEQNPREYKPEQKKKEHKKNNSWR